MKTVFYLFPFLLVPIWCCGQHALTLEMPKQENNKSEMYLRKTYQLTLSAALELTEKARDKAKAMNKAVAIAILATDGQIIVLSNGDEVGVHNIEAARRKAFTAVSTKISTLTLSRNAKANPDTQNLANLPELLLLGGGIPLHYNNKVVGAIGVAGGGSPENDDTIAKAAILPKAGILIK